MENREKELNEVKKVSGQILSITQLLTTSVKQQGEHLNSIEDNVILTKENAFKAEEEIKEAEGITRKISRKIWLLFALIFFIVIAIVLVVVLLLTD